MPTHADRTVADQINEFLAPEQPDDCRQANLENLARALQVTGPVVHRGQVVSSTVEGDEHKVDFDAEKGREHVASLPIGEDGSHPILPPDDQLSEVWSIPAASATNLPAEAIRHPRGH